MLIGQKTTMVVVQPTALVAWVVVITLLVQSPLPVLTVRVEAAAGRVHLRGTVDYIEQSEACSDIAKRIKGVRVLENHLHVAETGRPGGE